MSESASPRKTDARAAKVSSQICHRSIGIQLIGLSSQVQTRFLSHTSEQRNIVAQFYDTPEGQHSFCVFEKGDPASQMQARALLIKLGLDQASRNALDSRWNVQWSTTWDVGGGGDSRKRTLFQWCLFLNQMFLNIEYKV